MQLLAKMTVASATSKAELASCDVLLTPAVHWNSVRGMQGCFSFERRLLLSPGQAAISFFLISPSKLLRWPHAPASQTHSSTSCVAWYRGTAKSLWALFYRGWICASIPKGITILGLKAGTRREALPTCLGGSVGKKVAATWAARCR